MEQGRFTLGKKCHAIIKLFSKTGILIPINKLKLINLANITL